MLRRFTSYILKIMIGQKKKKSKVRLNSTEYQALRSLILDRHVDWETLFELFAKDDISIDRIVMGEDFLQAVKDCYNLKYSQVVFSDFLWTMRSIYLPLFFTLSMKVPKADLYHCVATDMQEYLAVWRNIFMEAVCFCRSMEYIRESVKKSL